MLQRFPQPPAGLESGSPTQGVRSFTGLKAVGGITAAAIVMALSLIAFVGAGQGTPRGASPGHVAFDFSVRASDAGRVSLAEFRGRPVVLLFTDTRLDGLTPHRALADAFAAIEGDRPVVLAITPPASAPTFEPGREAADVRHLFGGTPDVLHLPDLNQEIATRYQIDNRPTAIVVSARGIILDRGPAMPTVARLARTIRKADGDEHVATGELASRTSH